MSVFDRFLDAEKTSKITIKNPRTIYGDLMKTISGSGQARKTLFDIFYQIIAFKGVCEGVGCSTIVANTAIALADLGLTVCVVDTSIMNPVQDIILKTNYIHKVEDKDDRLDWFDMPYTKLSVLHESSVRKNISVLSFYGKDRGVIDALSVSDNADLVELAYSTLHTRFDLILVDCCHEMTSINTAALQQAQHCIQVWNDTPSVLHSIQTFINNSATLSCPLDKMRNVVYSKVIKDIVGNIDDMLAQYKLTKLAEIGFSMDIQRVITLGKVPYQFVTTEPDLEEFTTAIIQIVCHICNIDLYDNQPRGTITSNDIMEGKVEGTLNHEYKEFNEKLEEEIHPVRTLEDADAVLDGKEPVSNTEPTESVALGTNRGTTTDDFEEVVKQPELETAETEQTEPSSDTEEVVSEMESTPVTSTEEVDVQNDKPLSRREKKALEKERKFEEQERKRQEKAAKGRGLFGK